MGKKNKIKKNGKPALFCFFKEGLTILSNGFSYFPGIPQSPQQ